MLEQRISVPTHDGITLVADAWGDPDRPGVMLAHGGGQTRHSWQAAAQALVRGGYHVVNLDLRGHGDSQWAPDSRYGVEDFAADMATIAEHFRREYALVGASLGGLSALTAVNRGLRPRALVMVDIVPFPEPAGIDRIVAFMEAHQGGFATIGEAVDAVAAYNPHRPRPPRPEGLARNLRLREGRYFWHWDPGITRMRSDDMYHRIAAETAAAAWDAQVPTLLVRGARSDIVSDEGIVSMRALLPSLDVADVAAAGHMVAGDDNDSFNTAVMHFLARHMPAGQSAE